MRDDMTVEDAINVVHVLGCELTSDGSNDDVRRLLSAATSLVTHVKEQAAEYGSDPGAEERAWTDFCQALLASNSFLYVR